jgi:hypothetical protein
MKRVRGEEVTLVSAAFSQMPTDELKSLLSSLAELISDDDKINLANCLLDRVHDKKKITFVINVEGGIADIHHCPEVSSFCEINDLDVDE